MALENQPYIKVYIPNEETGEEEEKSVRVVVLFNRMREEYIRDILPDEYARGLLSDHGLSPCEVFHMMERLQMGKAEYRREDYREVSYL